MIQHFSFYYFVNLLSNAFLLSFYTVMLAIDHITCKTKVGHNDSFWFRPNQVLTENKVKGK